MTTPLMRHTSGYPNLDRAFGGGMVRGSLSFFRGVKVGLLLLEVAHRAAEAGGAVLYVGDPLDAIRDGWTPPTSIPGRHRITFATAWERVAEAIAEHQPGLVVLSALEHLSVGGSKPGGVATLVTLADVLAAVAHPATGRGPVVLVRTANIGFVQHAGDATFTMSEWSDDVLRVTADRNRYGLAGESADFELEDGRLVEPDAAKLTPWSEGDTGP